MHRPSKSCILASKTKLEVSLPCQQWSAPMLFYIPSFTTLPRRMPCRRRFLAYQKAGWGRDDIALLRDNKQAAEYVLNRLVTELSMYTEHRTFNDWQGSVAAPALCSDIESIITTGGSAAEEITSRTHMNEWDVVTCKTSKNGHCRRKFSGKVVPFSYSCPSYPLPHE